MTHPFIRLLQNKGCFIYRESHYQVVIRKAISKLVILVLITMSYQIVLGCASSDFSLILATRPDRLVTSANILVGPDGIAYDNPTSALYTKIDSASPSEVAHIMNDLLDIVDRPGGYARVIAAKTILAHWQFIEDRQRATRIIGKNVVCLNHTIAGTFPDEWLDNPPEALFRLIDVHCAVFADNRLFELQSGLPDGWRALSGEVRVDDKIVAISTSYAQPTLPIEFVNLREILGTGNYGLHTVSAKLSLASPTDERTTVTTTQKFEIVMLGELLR